MSYRTNIKTLKYESVFGHSILKEAFDIGSENNRHYLLHNMQTYTATLDLQQQTISRIYWNLAFSFPWSMKAAFINHNEY